jgi:hypothetical protein
MLFQNSFILHFCKYDRGELSHGVIQRPQHCSPAEEWAKMFPEHSFLHCPCHSKQPYLPWNFLMSFVECSKQPLLAWGQYTSPLLKAARTPGRQLGGQFILAPDTVFCFVFFPWGMNSGLHTCKTGTLPLGPHLHSILFDYFFGHGGLSNYLPWPWTKILLTSASQVARITDVSHKCRLHLSFLREK